MSDRAFLKFDRPQAIILSHQRSGTHFLQSALANHPRIRGRGECFLRYQRWLHGTNPEEQHLVDNHRCSLFENSSEHLNIGILMYNHIQHYDISFELLTSVKIIHLLRDPLEIAKSEAQKEANRRHYKGGYASHYRAGEVHPVHQPFSAAAADEMIATITQRQTYFSNRLRGCDNVLTVTYEVLANNRQTSQLDDDMSMILLGFLGLDFHPLRTTLQKTGLYSDVP